MPGGMPGGMDGGMGGGVSGQGGEQPPPELPPDVKKNDEIFKSVMRDFLKKTGQEAPAPSDQQPQQGQNQQTIPQQAQAVPSAQPQLPPRG